jgi:hypothetical protein
MLLNPAHFPSIKCETPGMLMPGLYTIQGEAALTVLSFDQLSGMNTLARKQPKNSPNIMTLPQSLGKRWFHTLHLC